MSRHDFQKKQPQVFEQLKGAWQKNKLVHAYLFHGTYGSGMEEAANWLAKTIFCQEPGPDGACNQCWHCQRIDAQDFPDLEVIEPSGLSIKVDQIRDMIAQMNYSSLETGKKVYILSAVETLSQGAANSLLKFIEEPEKNIYFILLTTQKEKVLPTILSRCQTLHFPALSEDRMVEALLEKGLPQDQSQILSLLTKDLKQALEWAEQEDFFPFVSAIGQWVQRLLEADSQAFILVQTSLMAFLNNRSYAHLGLELATIYMRDCLLLQNGQEKACRLPNSPKKYARITSDTSRGLFALTQAKRALEANVSPQVAYESLCLDLLDFKKG